jgi:hypothetical protein
MSATWFDGTPASGFHVTKIARSSWKTMGRSRSLTIVGS